MTDFSEPDATIKVALSWEDADLHTEPEEVVAKVYAFDEFVSIDLPIGEGLSLLIDQQEMQNLRNAKVPPEISYKRPPDPAIIRDES